jgi:hypothetical protein
VNVDGLVAAAAAAEAEAVCLLRYGDPKELGPEGERSGGGVGRRVEVEEEDEWRSAPRVVRVVLCALCPEPDCVLMHRVRAYLDRNL